MAIAGDCDRNICSGQEGAGFQPAPYAWCIGFTIGKDFTLHNDRHDSCSISLWSEKMRGMSADWWGRRLACPEMAGKMPAPPEMILIA
jgi:hypothetical protein